MGFSSKDRRRIAEGATRGNFGGHKCPPTRRKRTRELSRQNRDTQWRGWRGGEKKEKAPQEKSPQQKKRNRCLRLRLLTGGCAALLSRFFSLFLRRLRRLLFLPSPRFSLLLWAAAPPLLFASPPLLFRFLRRLRRLTLLRALVGGWRRPLAPLSYTMKSRLSETHMGIGVPLSPDCENQRFSCQGLLRLSLSEACFVAVTCHKLICSPLDFASARHPKGPLSKATGFLHILP